MKKTLMLTAALIALSATMATADAVDDVIASLSGDGYERIHVRPSDDVIRVAAIKDGVRFDLAFDPTTGAVITEQSRPSRADDVEGNGRIRAAQADGATPPPRRAPRPEGAEANNNDDRRGPPPPPRGENAEAGEDGGERRGPPRRGPRPPRDEQSSVEE